MGQAASRDRPLLAHQTSMFDARPRITSAIDQAARRGFSPAACVTRQLAIARRRPALSSAAVTAPRHTHTRVHKPSCIHTILPPPQNPENACSCVHRPTADRVPYPSCRCKGGSEHESGASPPPGRMDHSPRRSQNRPSIPQAF